MINKDTCEIYCYDEEKVNRIQGNLQTVDISSVAPVLTLNKIEQKLPMHCVKMTNCVCVILQIL